MVLHPRFPGTPEKQEEVAEVGTNVDFLWGVKVPMRDGTRLNATVYKPKGTNPVPAILTLTPYVADSYHPRAFHFAQHGYAFVLVDCRGRGNSEGKFEPMMNEGPDGHDLVEWLAAQPWCNGSVTMWGGSYGGFDQWMTLKQFPPRLKTIGPAAAAHQGVDIPFFKNIFYSYEMQWLTLVSGVTGNSNLFGEQASWIEKFRELYLIAKGSRLRLVINCANSIFVQKNYNSGGLVAEESGRDARTAHVTLYHNEEHPSFLELPIVTPAATDGG